MKIKARKALWVTIAIATYTSCIVLCWHEVRQSNYTESVIFPYTNQSNGCNLISNDSNLRLAVDFYNNPLRFWTSSNKRLRAYYLLGLSHLKKSDHISAIIALEDGVSSVDTLSIACNYSALASIYRLLAQEYFKQNMPNKQLQAIKLYKKYSTLAQLPIDNEKDLIDGMQDKDAISVDAIQSNEEYYNKKLDKITINQRNYRSRVRLIISIILVFMCLGLIHYIFIRRRKAKELEVLMSSYDRTKIALHKASDELYSLQNRMPELEESRKLLNEKDMQINQLTHLIANYKNENNAKTHESNEEGLMASEIVCLFKDICRIHTQRKGRLIRIIKPRACDTREWKKLVSTVRTYHYSFYHYITIEKVLPTLQHKVCILSRLGFNTAEMAILLGSSEQSISNARSRAVKNLFDSDDTRRLGAWLSEL